MQLKNKNKLLKNYWKIGFSLFLLFFSLSFLQEPLRADQLDDLLDEACKDLSEKDCEDLRDEADDKESQFDTLDNQLKNAQKLVKLKQQQAQTLAGQVQILNLEINNVQGDIGSLKKEIDTTQENIDEIKKQIDTRQQNIKENQKNLGEMLRNYYKLHQTLGLSLLSSEGGLNEVFTQSDYLSQISTKINNALKIIREEKAALNEKREEHEIEKGKLDDQKSELDEEKQALSLKKGEKSNLLTRTKGEEAGYQNLIAKIESQMKQLLIDVDSLTVAEESEISEILKNADEPEEGKASTKWYYSQRDSKWSNDSIGGTSLTMGSYGCAVTSVAMVFTYHGEDIEPDDIAKKNSYFYSGLMDWGDGGLLSKYDMKLKVKTGHSTSLIDWDDIKDYIEDDDLPVIVFIKGSGSKGHYVVIHGYDDKNDDFVVHDPYWGSNLLLGTSKKIVKSIYGSASIDQMIVYKSD